MRGRPTRVSVRGRPTRVSVQGRPTRVSVQGRPTRVSVQGSPTRVSVQGRPTLVSCAVHTELCSVHKTLLYFFFLGFHCQTVCDLSCSEQIFVHWNKSKLFPPPLHQYLPFFFQWLTYLIPFLCFEIMKLILLSYSGLLSGYHTGIVKARHCCFISAVPSCEHPTAHRMFHLFFLGISPLPNHMIHTSVIPVQHTPCASHSCSSCTAWPWQWWHYNPSKCCDLLTQWHSDTFQ